MNTCYKCDSPARFEFYEVPEMGLPRRSAITRPACAVHIQEAAIRVEAGHMISLRPFKGASRYFSIKIPLMELEEQCNCDADGSRDLPHSVDCTRTLAQSALEALNGGPYKTQR